MSITGDADGDGGHPTKVGVAISDVVTGLYAVVGILAACSSGTGGGSGRGQRVDASLLGVDPGGPRQPGPERRS